MKKLVMGLMVVGVFLFVTNAFALVGIDANTVLMLHFNGDDGSTNFIDSSFINHSLTAYDNAQIDTAQSKFGGASGLFDGDSDYLYLADSDDWNFGSGDFTIDSWVRFNTIKNTTFLSQYENASNRSYLQYYNTDSKLYIIFRSAGVYIGRYSCSWTPSTNTWYHLAFIRNGSTALISINGVFQTLTEINAFNSGDVGNLSSALFIGQNGFPDEYLDGWFDEFRISKGIARWTSNFTPSTSEYEVASEKVIPEPATLSLLNLGLLGLVYRRKKAS